MARLSFVPFGDKIRKLRKEKKMTQQKLGAMVGVSYRTIRAWEVDGRYRILRTYENKDELKNEINKSFVKYISSKVTY